MNIQTLTIQAIREEHIESFRDAVDAVSREGKYLLFEGAPPIESTREFVRGTIRDGLTQLVARDGTRVVGWIDILPAKRPGLQHCAHLGMGILSEFRGQGLGRKLLANALDDVKKQGVECVRLEVFASNTRAIKLLKASAFSARVSSGVQGSCRIAMTTSW